MSHEQSETIERDGKFYNVYGKNTPKAGQDLPGEPAYDTLDAAVGAAKKRSASYVPKPEDFGATKVEGAKPEGPKPEDFGAVPVSPKSSIQSIGRELAKVGRARYAQRDADMLRQMDRDVDYSGVASPGLRAEYGFLDTPEERQAFLQKHFG